MLLGVADDPKGEGWGGEAGQQQAREATLRWMLIVHRRNDDDS